MQKVAKKNILLIISHIFQIQLKHNLSALNEIKQGQVEFNSGKQELNWIKLG